MILHTMACTHTQYYLAIPETSEGNFKSAFGLEQRQQLRKTLFDYQPGCNG